MRNRESKLDSTYNRMATFFTIGGMIILAMFLWAFFALNALD